MALSRHAAGQPDADWTAEERAALEALSAPRPGTISPSTRRKPAGLGEQRIPTTRAVSDAVLQNRDEGR